MNHLLSIILFVLLGYTCGVAQNKERLKSNVCIHVVDYHILYSKESFDITSYSTERFETYKRVFHEDPEEYEGREERFWNDKRTEKSIHEIKDYIINELCTYCKKTGIEFVGGGFIKIIVKDNGSFSLQLSFRDRTKKLLSIRFIYKLCHDTPTKFQFKHISEYNLYTSTGFSTHITQQDVIGDNEGRYK